MQKGKVVVVDRWSLKQGFPETDRFFEALLNSCERFGTHAFDLRIDNSRQSGASGFLFVCFIMETLQAEASLQGIQVNHKLLPK